ELGRLLRERVRRAAPVVVEVDAAREVLVQHLPRLCRRDPAEVQAFRQEDDVAGEAVAADVGRLPYPALFGLGLERLVERPAATGTAAVVLAVRADEQDGVTDYLAARGGRVEAEQVVVAVELGVEELPASLRRAPPDHLERGVG